MTRKARAMRSTVWWRLVRKGERVASIVPMLYDPMVQVSKAITTLAWKLISCSHVKSWVNLLNWLLIGCSLLCS